MSGSKNLSRNVSSETQVSVGGPVGMMTLKGILRHCIKKDDVEGMKTPTALVLKAINYEVPLEICSACVIHLQIADCSRLP